MGACYCSPQNSIQNLSFKYFSIFSLHQWQHNRLFQTYTDARTTAIILTCGTLKNSTSGTLLLVPVSYRAAVVFPILSTLPRTSQTFNVGSAGSATVLIPASLRTVVKACWASVGRNLKISQTHIFLTVIQVFSDQMCQQGMISYWLTDFLCLHPQELMWLLM